MNMFTDTLDSTISSLDSFKKYSNIRFTDKFKSVDGKAILDLSYYQIFNGIMVYQSSEPHISLSIEETTCTIFYNGNLITRLIPYNLIIDDESYFNYSLTHDLTLFCVDDFEKIRNIKSFIEKYF